MRGSPRGAAPQRGAGHLRPAAIIDVDGTLVDTNYHHAVAWYRAFRQHGKVIALWEIHRHMGMGGDHLVASLTDDEFEREHGDDVRSAEKALYLGLIEEVEPLAHARELLERLKERGHEVVLASSAKAQEVDHYLDLLGARELADAWTTSADVEATKPEPDLIAAAMEQASASEGVMIGDSTWDCIAAREAGLQTIGLLTGGFHELELREAGAACVFYNLRDLLERLEETPLG